ncbi:MAG: 6-carboxytetrahydropterin synthase, partial [Bacteroidia bacterium]|nr:6-carboxytetrahydropterin synthase [Bacteroidia bacterium]
RYDHKNLNLECPEFKDKNPTAEYICYNIWKIMNDLLGDRFDVNIRLWETPRNAVEYPPLS